jgi:hypothetical protein
MYQDGHDADIQSREAFKTAKIVEGAEAGC